MIDDINPLDISSFTLNYDDLWFLDQPKEILSQVPPHEASHDEEYLRDAGLINPLPNQSESPVIPQGEASNLHLHIQCVDCAFDIVVASLDEEGSRYTHCKKCGKKLFVVHGAAMCMRARMFCPIFREMKGMPRMDLNFWKQQVMQDLSNGQNDLENF